MMIERPRVTFAVFAYNQEQFVPEAIEGALAQTYEPLEIILSDDCSSDRTFDIMREMAAAYDGPHDVKARRTAQNAGLLNHVLDVADVAEGALLVVSAGDDISLPSRTGALVDAWAIGASGALFSSYVPMGNDSMLLERDPKAQGLERTIPFLAGSGESLPLVLGATAAYDVELLRSIPKPLAKIFHEDIIFTNITYLRGREITYVDTPLVKYRFADFSREDRSSIRDAYHAILDWEMRANHRLRDYKDVLAYMDAILTAEDGPKERQLLCAERSENDFMNDFVNGSLLRRFTLLGRCQDRALLRWALPRVFGFQVFSGAKALLSQWRDGFCT